MVATRRRLSMNLALSTLYASSVFVAPLESRFGWKRADPSMVFTIAESLRPRLPLFLLRGGRRSRQRFRLCHAHSVMAKWFPDKRGLAVGLAVGGYGAGSAIFGPLAQLKLIPAYGLPATFQILAAIFFVMTAAGALLLRNPPAGYQPDGWSPAAVSSAALSIDFTPSEVLRTRTFYLMWIAYALGTSAGLMVISQIVPSATSAGIAAGALSAMTLVVGACGNAMGRTFSGCPTGSAG